MWRRRKMKYLLSCLFCKVLSLVLHRFSCAELAAPAEMWDVDGALLCDQGGSAGISRDWQARGWLCWNWAPHQHQTWCFIWGKSQIGFSAPAVRNASCSVKLMSVPSLLFLESDTYCYLLLAVVAAIIFCCCSLSVWQLKEKSWMLTSDKCGWPVLVFCLLPHSRYWEASELSEWSYLYTELYQSEKFKSCKSLHIYSSSSGEKNCLRAV